MAASTPSPTVPDTEAETTVKKTRNRKAAPSKSVDDLLASFSPAATPEASAAEQARKNTIEAIDTEGAAFARRIAELTTGSKDTDSVKAALVSLQTTLKRAEKAVGGIPDEVLAPSADADILA